MTDTQAPQLVMLCGIPTCGKTTYLVKYLQETERYDDYAILSTDAYIDNRALENDITYNEAFDAFIKQASRRMMFDLEVATRNDRNIVWDQTNLTAQSRKAKLAKIPARYRKVAVWFDLSLEEAMIRNQQRPGKVIPGDVLKRMFHTFMPPTEAEGFDVILRG
jgi:predicted kinase